MSSEEALIYIIGDTDQIVADVLNEQRNVKNDVRALLREAGLKVGAPSRKDFPAHGRDLAGAIR